tara:strand:- start:780 stop:977 length:198 start_codon:yes stop_codon:yes gene_type:complete
MVELIIIISLIISSILGVILHMIKVENHSDKSVQKKSDDKLVKQYAMNPRLSEDSKQFIGGVPSW